MRCINLQSQSEQSYPSGKYMESDEDSKRQYLREQIIEGGYDQEEFIEFLQVSSSKGSEGEMDISLWSLEQLKNLVNQFKALHKGNAIKKRKSQSPGKNQKVQRTNSEEKVDEGLKPKPQTKTQGSTQNKNKPKMPPVPVSVGLDQRAEQGPTDPRNTVYHGLDQNRQQVFSETIPCISIQPSSLLTANVKVNLIKYEKKEGGIFQKSYILYTISTPFLKKTVQRRYSDFLWLKEILEQLHPGIPVPPIAKKGQFRRYDDKHLNKRLMILQMFLNKLLQVPELRSDQLLQNFLKFDDVVTFQKFKSQFRKQETPWNKLKNTKGKLNLAIDPKINRFLRKSQKYFNDSQPDIKRIFKQFKGAATMLEGAVFHLNSIVQICKLSDLRDQKFRKETETKYFATNMFTVIEKMSQKYAVLLKKQADTFRKEVYSTVKYEYLNSVNLLQNFDKLASLQNEYQNGRVALDKKKERLYEEGNTAKWGNPELTSKDRVSKPDAIAQMLPRETKDIQKLRQNYALHNFYLYEEVQRHFERNSIHLAGDLQAFAEAHSRINGQSMMLWVDILTQIMAMKQGKSIQNFDPVMGK